MTMQTFLRRVAQLLSFVFHPVFVPTYAAILYMSLFRGYFSLSGRVSIVSVVFMLTAMIPAVTLLVAINCGRVDNFMVSNRLQRPLIYCVAIIATTACTFFVWLSGLGVYATLTMIGCTVALIISVIVNVWWKISAHSMAAGAACGAIFSFGLGFAINNILLQCAALLIAGLVCAARIYLREHTLMQTLAGFVVGCACTCSVLWIWSL